MNKNYLLASLLLISLLIASGCGNSQRAVVVENGGSSGDAGESSQQEGCTAESDSCVAELKDSELTGEYLRVGKVKEGEVFELDFDKSDNLDNVCDEGLVPASHTIVVDGECAYPTCPCYICVKCPNGECGEGENECNCPQDC